MSTISAKKIYQHEQLIYDNNKSSTFTIQQINNTPVQAWLVKNPYCCGGNEEWQLEFKQPDSLINVLTGVWLEYGTYGCLIDGNQPDVAAKMNGCCGDSAVVTPNYGAALPPYQAPVYKTYTVVRTDDGSIAASIDAELAYASSGSGELIKPNSFTKVSYSGTQSTYSFQAYRDPAPQGTDTITETARTFDSNVAPTLSGSNVFNASGIADGLAYHVKGTTALSGLVTALNADAVTSLFGTWTVVSTHVHLSTTSKDLVTIVVDQEAP